MGKCWPCHLQKKTDIASELCLVCSLPFVFLLTLQESDEGRRCSNAVFASYFISLTNINLHENSSTSGFYSQLVIGRIHDLARRAGCRCTEYDSAAIFCRLKK